MCHHLRKDATNTNHAAVCAKCLQQTTAFTVLNGVALVWSSASLDTLLFICCIWLILALEVAKYVHRIDCVAILESVTAGCT